MNTACKGPNNAPADRLRRVAGKNMSGRIANNAIKMTGAQIPYADTVLAIVDGYSLSGIPDEKSL